MRVRWSLRQNSILIGRIVRRKPSSTSPPSRVVHHTTSSKMGLADPRVKSAASTAGLAQRDPLARLHSAAALRLSAPLQRPRHLSMPPG